MKFSVPLLVFATCFLTACATSANRREFYSPKKADGPWTRSLEDGSYKERELVDARVGGSRNVAPEKPTEPAAKTP